MNESSNSENKAAYMVFSNATLMAIAEMNPTNENELLSVPGVGPMKIENYGDDVLAILGAL